MPLKEYVFTNDLRGGKVDDCELRIRARFDFAAPVDT